MPENQSNSVLERASQAQGSGAVNQYLDGSCCPDTRGSVYQIGLRGMARLSTRTTPQPYFRLAVNALATRDPSAAGLPGSKVSVGRVVRPEAWRMTTVT